MPLPSSPNTLHFGGLADNNESASKDSISLQAYSRIFSEGSEVGDVDGDGTGDQPADRTLLNTAPYALSKFYDAHIPNDQFGSVVSKLVDGTDVSSNGYVDGEAGRIYWTITEDPEGSTTYTGGLKYKSDASVAASSTLAFDGTGTKYVTIAAPSTTQQIGSPYKYYSFVSTAEFKNAVGADLSHYDQLSGGSVNSSATSHTLDASSETNALTIAPVVSVGTQASYSTSTSTVTAGDNQGISISGANVTMTGAGVTQITVTHIGNPTQARNSTTSPENITVTYNRAIESLTLVTSDTVNYGGNNVTISAISEGVQQNNFHVGYDDNNTSGDTGFTSLYDNVTSLYVRTTVSKTFTAPAGSYYIKAKHTGDGSSIVGVPFIVAPTFVYTTVGDSADISVNGTSHTFRVTSATGDNKVITISNNLNATTTTDYTTGYTLAPGESDGIYTVTYTGTANYSQTNNQTDTVNVYPDAAFSVSDTTLLINAPAGSGLSDDNLNISNTSVGANISALLWTITKDGGGTVLTSSDPAISVTSGTLEGVSWGVGTYNVSLRVTGGGSLQNTETGNDNFTITNHPPQALNITNPVSVHIARRGTATSITWSKTSATAVTIVSYKASSAIDTISSGNTGLSTSWTPDGGDSLGTDWRIYGSVDSGTESSYTSYFTLKDGIALAPSTPSDSSGNETAGISWSDGSYNGGGNKVYTYSDSGGSSQTAVSSTIAGTSYTYSESRTSTTVTRYFRVSGINNSGEEGDKSGVSGGANIYPILSEEFQAADISFSVDPVEVGAATELRIANVADNIVGYTWSELGTGGMSVTSGTASTGDRDGTSGDSTGLIDESNITVTFDTAEQDKTVQLVLYARNSQTVTRTKNIDVELADALTISGIGNTNGTNSVTVSGNQSGFQYGVTAGLATNASPTSFITSTEETTNPDSRFTLRSYSESFTPADQVTTQYLVGRVVADTDGDALNTSAFYYYPKLKAGRNQITPSSATITTAQSVSFTTPQTATDNVTKYVYTTSETITNATQYNSGNVISHTTAVFTSAVVGVRTVTLVVSGLSGQNDVAGGTASITVNYAPEVTSVVVTPVTKYSGTTIYVRTSFQGFGLTTEIDKIDHKLFNSGGILQSTQTVTGLTIGAGSPGSAAEYNHTWGTITTGGDYYFTSVCYDEQNDASYSQNSSQFTIQSTTQHDLNGQSVLIGSDVIGYNTLLDAADTTPGAYSQRDGARQTWASTGTLADDVRLYTDSGLGSAYNGNDKYFSRGGYVFQVESDGDIDDYRSRTPNTPANPSSAANGTDDIYLSIGSSNTMVTRTIRVRSNTSIGGNTERTLSPSQSTTYSNSNISMKSLFGTGLVSGQTYVFDIRAENNDGYNSSYTSTTSAAPDSAPDPVWGSQPSIGTIRGLENQTRYRPIINPSSFTIGITNADTDANQVTATISNIQGSHQFTELTCIVSTGTIANSASWPGEGATSATTADGSSDTIHFRFRIDSNRDAPQGSQSGTLTFTLSNGGVDSTFTNVAWEVGEEVR